MEMLILGERQFPFCFLTNEITQKFMMVDSSPIFIRPRHKEFYFKWIETFLFLDPSRTPKPQKA